MVKPRPKLQMATRKPGYKCILKPKQLESILDSLESLESQDMTPDVWELEQYSTPAHIASHILMHITRSGNIEGKNIVDLGCGCGVLSIGSALLGAKSVTAIDVDPRCLEVLSDNIEEVDVKEIVSCIESDVYSLDPSKMSDSVSPDVVIMNPPFGTKKRKGADRMFVEKALQIAPTVYSLHKSSTRDYWMKKASVELNCLVEAEIQVLYNIKNQCGFHVNKNKDIKVDLLKFSRK